MRLRASLRRRLWELLQNAGGDVAVASAVPYTKAWRNENGNALDYLLRTAPVEVTTVLRTAKDLAAGLSEDFADCRHPYLVEQLLAIASHDRKQRGIYFTPPEIVNYIVRTVDESLVRDLGWSDGLASNDARILDPATGSGVFLAEVVRVLHQRILASGRSVTEIHALWTEFVSHQLLSRLVGWELMPANVTAAHCVIADALHGTAYRFADSPRLRIELRDALSPPSDDERFNVILGNPPYASLSTARHGWIESLIQSSDDGYMTVDGQPLGEKKHWLHDDYVKFLRLAQWHVEQCGRGVVGMVTNHGYLTNASFRGMRASLLKTFPSIQVVDLHGNAKMQERSPNGPRDENVFGIGSGVAIGIFTRPSARPSSARVHHSNLWGTRASKLEQLAAGPTTALFTPVGPHYRIVPSNERACGTYQAAWRLCDAMPVATTAPVTARDHFVTAFTLDELVQRVDRFRDLTIPDDVIRERYFHRTRSSKYPSGDSRGWKLSAARQTLAEDDNWRQRLTICQYRPFDYRYILWHEALIDWPRREVMRYLLEHENLALIARRQSPAGLPANFFWATKALTLDGILRSDNRGSESLFPLWLYDDSGSPRSNFAPAFAADVERAIGKPFQIAGPGPTKRDDFTPLTLAGYIYGLFWSPDYRQRYRQQLSEDFPRILLPDNAAHFFARAYVGLALLRRHIRMTEGDPKPPTLADPTMASGFPRWRKGQVWINPTTAIADLSEEAWQLKVGAHQVAGKWLKDRRDRMLTSLDISMYRGIAQTLTALARQERNPLPSGDSAKFALAQVF